MAFTRLITTTIALSLLVIGPAKAIDPVIDVKAIEQLKNQVKQLTKQVEELQKIRDKTQDMVDAVGKMGQITIPMVNGAQMASRLKKDMSCLLPDLSQLMPQVEFEEYTLGSVCSASEVYKHTLWVDPYNLRQKAADEQNQILGEVRERRQNVLNDAALKGLGQADVAFKAVQDLNEAASETEGAARSATDQNTRLAVIAESMPQLMRAQAQTNQILAQMLKLLSAFVMEASGRLESSLLTDEDGEEGQ